MELLDLLKNDTFWTLLTAGLIYLSGAWLRPLVEKLPKTNVVFRIIRLAHLGLNRIDPEGNDTSTKTTTTLSTLVLLSCFASLTQTACTASFEEVRLVSATSTRKAAPRDDNECNDIDRRHRIWGGIEYGALAATGASGLSTIPVNNDTGRTALAVTALVFVGTAAVSKFEDNEATKAWTSQCTEGK